MSSPCSQRPQRRRQHTSLSGRTDSSAESDEETKVANERRSDIGEVKVTNSGTHLNRTKQLAHLWHHSKCD